ncbi:MAG TPA: ABC transporter substrate-binding protein [Candidatus Binatia bacterium]|jgi:ABC-type nitrate/sulfonate/bicarbonate transport system substrate-binding protein
MNRYGLKFAGLCAAAWLLCLSSFPSQAAALDRVRVALSTKDYGYLPLFVGMRAGLFKEEGLEVQWLVVNTSVVITALMAGELDVAGAAGSSMRAATRGAPLKAIFFTHQRCTFVLIGAPEIKKVQDLKGKVIGITSPGSSTELAASMVLEQYGMNPKKDVTFFSVGGSETSVQAMQQKIIHARAFNPDAAFLLKKRGFNELASLAELGAWPWAGYATTEAKLTQERDKIKRWTRAMVKAILFMVNKKEETIKIAMQEFGHARDVAEGASAVSIRAIDARDPGGASDESLRKNILDTIVTPLNLKEAPPIAKLVDFSVLREAQKEVGLGR